MEEALRADLREVLGPHVDLSRVSEWIGKGYDSGMVREVVRDLRRRKDDINALGAGRLRCRDGLRQGDCMFVRTGIWSRYAGPEPGMIGCRAPLELLAKYGVDATSGQRIRKASRALDRF